jgi:hypothetical protein
MDYLFNAVKNLSAKEVLLLRKKIGKQSQKLKLFNYVYELDDSELKEIMDKLGYTEKPAGFYTLKNRLYEDVIDVKMELEKNEVIITKEKVQNLRGLVYSHDAQTLMRELHRLEKKCFELELFAEQKEIYFCYMLLYRHDKKKVSQYKSLMDDADFKQKNMMKLEELFYTKLLDTQDLFYFNNSFFYNEARDLLEQVKMADDLLRCKSSSFLYLSAKLTLRLTYGISKESTESKEIFRELVTMNKLYHSTFLINRYPNCNLAIHCLFSKYYYLMGMNDQFENSQKYMMEKISTVRGFKMFECTIFYFIYITVLSKVDVWDRQRLSQQIALLLSDEKMEYFSSSMKNYFYYLLAVKEFYVGNHNKSSALLLQSRKYFTSLSNNNCWIAVENIVLNIYNYSITGDYTLISSEIGLLTRVTSRFNFEDNYVKSVKEIIKTTKHSLNTKDFSQYPRDIARLKKMFDNQFYKLLSF